MALILVLLQFQAHSMNQKCRAQSPRPKQPTPAATTTAKWRQWWLLPAGAWCSSGRRRSRGFTALALCCRNHAYLGAQRSTDNVRDAWQSSPLCCNARAHGVKILKVRTTAAAAAASL